MATSCSNFDPSLIIDAGAHDGSDTAYYLHCGYRVVAVEANPILAEDERRRFPSEVSSGRLQVLNVAISDQAGESDFWISDTNDQWGSLSKKIATRRGATVCEHPIRVQCLRLCDILRAVGTPYYLKLDIEGHDALGLESLTPVLTPQFVSVEFAHGMEMRLLADLETLGYFRFKLLNQSTFTDRPPIFQHEIGFRFARKLYRRVPPLRPLIGKIARRSDFDDFHTRHGWQFPDGSSGPFGDQTYGNWMAANEIRDRYRRLRRKYEKAHEVFWWDLHATGARPTQPRREFHTAGNTGAAAA
jgi:FkbM family methyltransferase